MGLINRNKKKDKFIDSQKRIVDLDKILIDAIKKHCIDSKEMYKTSEIIASLLIVATKINASDIVAYYEKKK